MKQFTLNPDVFLWYNEECALFYNSVTFKYLIFPVTKHIVDFCEKISQLDNMYSVPITIGSSYSEIENLIEQLVQSNFGIIADSEIREGVVPPSLYVETNWEQILESNLSESTEVLSYLTSITIFVEGNKDDNKYYLQTEYPIAGDEKMTIETLSAFLPRVKRSHVSRINIVVPRQIEEARLSALLELASEYDGMITFYAFSSGNIQRLWKEGHNRLVLLHMAENSDFDLYECSPASCLHRFLVTSETDIQSINKAADNRSLTNYELKPIFNGSNRDFVVDKLFLSRQEVLNFKYTKHNIFIHQAVNPFSFGHIFVTPEGQIFSNMLDQPIGTVQSDLHDIIINEMNSNYSWRKVRNLCECKKCVLVDLCPPPTVMESLLQVNCICKDKIKQSQAL